MKTQSPPTQITPDRLQRIMRALAPWLAGAAHLVLGLLPKRAQRRALHVLRRNVVCVLVKCACARVRGRFGDTRIARAHGPARVWSRNSNLRLVTGVRLRKMLRGCDLGESLNLLRMALEDPERAINALATRPARGMSKALQRLDYVLNSGALACAARFFAPTFVDTS